MASKQTIKLTVDKLKSLSYEKEPTINDKTGEKQYPRDIRFDSEQPGFGVRLFPSGKKSYVYQYWTRKAGQKQERRLLTIGYTTEISLKEAREKAQKHSTAVHDGSDPLKDRQQVQSAETYLQFIEQTYHPYLIAHLRGGIDNSDNVRETMATLRRTFSEFHNLELKEITPYLLEKWRQRRTTDGVKPSTINRQMNDLRACLNKAVEWEALTVSPFEKVKPSKTDRNQAVRYLTEREEARLRERLDDREAKMRAARENANVWREKRGYDLYDDLSDHQFVDYLKPAVLISLNTGLRRGELLGLSWTDVDLERRNLTVRGEGAKSGQTRHIPLNEEAFTVLKNWKAQPGLKSQLVFHGKNGEQLHNLRKAWQAVLDEEPDPIVDFRWHDLRHHFASKLVMAGADLNVVRELLGHSDYKMTLRYAHLAPEHKAAAVEMLVAPSKKRSQSHER